MRFSLEPQFTAAEIKKQVNEMLERVNRVFLNELTKIGLDAVKYARLKTKSQGGYDDQTGNLRSSIGFIIQYDGQTIHQDFELSPEGTDKQEGLRAGEQYAKELGANESSGWAVIIVAGMEYGFYLEAKGYDVISGSTLGMENKLRQLSKRMQKLKFT
ncbi:MAG TPA: hypothetical protein VGB63_16115 [Pedobacter sp.]|jgi:hypothetical protein